jgi:hypothetical protein
MHAQKLKHYPCVNNLAYKERETWVRKWRFLSVDWMLRVDVSCLGRKLLKYLDTWVYFENDYDLKIAKLLFWEWRVFNDEDKIKLNKYRLMCLVQLKRYYIKIYNY